MSMDSNVLERLIELSETGAVALMHIVAQAEQGKFEGTTDLFKDFMEAFAEIEGVLLGSSYLLKSPRLTALNDALKKSFSRLVECYENHDTHGFILEMNENIFKVYSDWQFELKSFR